MLSVPLYGVKTRTCILVLKSVRCIGNVTMKEDVKLINWTGTLTNERVLQSLIGERKGMFVDCSKATAEEVVRT